MPFLPAKPGPDLSGTGGDTGPATPVPGALPFAETVAETVAEAVMPVARSVGANLGERVERLTGGAGDLVLGGRSVVKGSVAILTDRLF